MARAKPARKAAVEPAAEVAARATGADRAVGRSIPRRPAPTPGLLPTAELVDTRSKILDAAYRCLATEGYAALSIREIGKAAGVNSALINYHFGTKDQLVIEVLDAANARLLARQKAMYRGPRGFAEKWAEARRFYEGDLASGFVRVQAELMAAGYSNPWLRERVAGRVEAWGDLIHDTVREALHELTAQGVELPAPLTAEVIANWMCHFWIGMEVGDLLGGWSRRRPNVAALDAVQELLDSLDTLAARRVRLATAGKGRVR